MKKEIVISTKLIKNILIGLAISFVTLYGLLSIFGETKLLCPNPIDECYYYIAPDFLGGHQSIVSYKSLKKIGEMKTYSFPEIKILFEYLHWHLIILAIIISGAITFCDKFKIKLKE